jgi:hypothetical protein
MTLKHVTLGFVSGISFSLISWMIGIIFNSLFSKRQFYIRFSDLNFVESDVFNRIIGLNQFCWIIKNTFFKFFNQKIRISNRNTNLDDLKKVMTLAEISHLVGFIFVTIFSIYYSIKVSILYGATMMVPNIFLNLYPSLLQQKNKRRINRLIKN